MVNRVEQSYGILDSLRLDHGLYLASPSDDYHYVWMRDSFYEVLPYLDKDCGRYEATYHRILDMFREYEWKLTIHTKQKPQARYEYIHAKYDAVTVQELDIEWGHAQHDAVGAVLFGIGEGIKKGKTMLRDEKDKEIIQKIVYYLGCCEYWSDPDNGMWEEWREVHMSSVGAVVAGLEAVRDVVFVPAEFIDNGRRVIDEMFPFESVTRPVDLAQLSLIYPYNILTEEQSKIIIHRVEKMLLRDRGVIRYMGDSYYATNEHLGRHLALTHYYGHEAEWVMGLSFLGLAHATLGDMKKLAKYIKRSNKVMLKDGSLPELYFADSKDYNGNTPLGWNQALYVICCEKLAEYEQNLN